ncbi:MAG: nucleotidyltransferase domain-containing protein [Candidatus Kuenenbacteria bacterium]
MSKKRIPKKLKNKIYEYIQILKKDKLPIKKVVLFGSRAKGTQNKWSDVDLCIISPKFKNAFDALQYLSSKVIFDMKYTIEPIGFSPEDFKDKYSSLIYEIKTTGIEILV